MSVIYTVLFQPIEYFIEVIFNIFYRAFNNSVIAAFMVSVLINILTFPLFNKAEQLQNIERDIQKSMRKDLSHIKQSFSGDEQWFILNTYYREKKYKPIYSLRSTISVALQIPFFLSAYNFFHKCQLPIHESFLCISDLSLPDRLIDFSFGHINVLPILMSLITAISNYYYTKDLEKKDKIQLYLMTILFLVLLYNSPAIMVLYWIFNNMLALLKIIYTKNKNILLPILKYFILFAGVISFLWFKKYGIWDGGTNNKFYYAILFISFVPIIYSIIKNILKYFFDKIHIYNNLYISKLFCFQFANDIMLLSLILFLLLTGITIVVSTIKISPLEFNGLNDCFHIIVYNFLIYFGISSWIFIYYLLSNNKKIFFLFTYFTLLFLVNHIYFTNNLGMISTQFIYDAQVHFSKNIILINLSISVVLFLIVFFLVKYKKNILKTILLILILFNVALNIYTIFNIKIELDKNTINVNENNTFDKIWKFSKKGKNVLLIWIDKAMGGYIPYIFNENKDFYKQYDGFTYYPNTVSYGMYTVISGPTIYGGYEYTPDEMNKRYDEKVVDKHDEGMQVLPVLFNNNDFNVYINDVPNMKFLWYSDMTTFERYNNIKTYHLNGVFRDNIIDDSTKILYKNYQKRNAFFYTMFRILPNAFKTILYNNGKYHAINPKLIMNEAFINNYSTLKQITKFVDVVDDNSNNMIMYYDQTPHEWALLNPKDYSILSDMRDIDIYGDRSRFVLDGKELIMDTDEKIANYDVNMVSYIEIGKLFDKMKELGVYDNTRILLLSDHGRPMGQYQNIVKGNNEYLGVSEAFNPVFMFKDYNMHGFNICDEFNTLANTPRFLTKDIIVSTKNPFTDNDINDNKYLNNECIVVDDYEYDVDMTTIPPDKNWYIIKENIYDLNNIEKIDYDPKKYVGKYE